MPPYTREYTVKMPLDLVLNKPTPQFSYNNIAGHPGAYLSVSGPYCASTSCPRCVFTCSVSLEAGMHHVSFIVCTVIVTMTQQHNAAVYWDIICIKF